ILIDEEHRMIPAKPGAHGMLATVTGAMGYFKDPEKTARTFTIIDDQRYVITGDWASIDEDGFAVLHGRGSNCINTGGEKVFPEEVEEAVKRHPAVDDCFVVGQPDDRFGNRVVAVVGTSADPAPTEADVRRFVRGQLAGYKVPKQVVLVPAVQRAPNGKADYGWAMDVASGAGTVARNQPGTA
ncbi:MAG: AMP-binding protein, partial [Gammaproteobacteria bacterium]|nr:AMP-binding protein [Gammaproteobacteria bacterium]